MNNIRCTTMLMIVLLLSFLHEGNAAYAKKDTSSRSPAIERSKQDDMKVDVKTYNDGYGKEDNNRKKNVDDKVNLFEYESKDKNNQEDADRVEGDSLRVRTKDRATRKLRDEDEDALDDSGLMRVLILIYIVLPTVACCGLSCLVYFTVRKLVRLWEKRCKKGDNEDDASPSPSSQVLSYELLSS